MTMTVGSLFSGIGGIDLGLERAGMRVVWQVENNPYAQAVLRKHWPSASLHGDVREVGSANLQPVDLICGGFPCQDISVAGNGAGIEGERSGLWREYLRIIRELRPRYVFMENVAALRSRGLDRVLGGLASLGYDAEWDCIPASAIGAPHQRDRLWLVAYPGGTGLEGRIVAAPARPTQQVLAGGLGRAGRNWPMPPKISGVGYGLPDWVDRLKCLGNAVVPQVAECIGRQILRHVA